MNTLHNNAMLHDSCSEHRPGYVMRYRETTLKQTWLELVHSAELCVMARSLRKFGVWLFESAGALYLEPAGTAR